MKNLKSIITVLSLSMLPIVGISAQETTLSLEQARHMALQHSQQMQMSDKTAEKAHYQTKQYRTNFFPKFEASGNYLLTNSKTNYTLDPNEMFVHPFLGRLQQHLPPEFFLNPDGTSWIEDWRPLPTSDYTFSLNNSYLVGVSAQQPIYMGGKITAAYQMAKIGEHIASLNREQTAAETLVQTEEAYWMCVKLVETVKAAEAYNEVVSEFVRVMENAVAAQMKPKNDLLKVQVKQNEAQLQLNKARNGLRLAQMNLNRLIGLPLATEIALTETLDNSGQITLLPQGGDFTARADYRMLQQLAELKAKEVQLVRSDYLPQIGVQASYNYINGPYLNDKALISRPAFSAIISVKVPIFHFGEGRHKVRAARVEQEMAQIRAEEAAQLMQLEIERYLQQWQEALLNTALAEKSLAQAAENMRLSKNQYEAGSELLADYLEAQTLWQKAWTDHIEAKTNVRLAQTRYQKAVGEVK